MVGFRVDSNQYIATGHLMRCISIAKQCQKIGEECFFILSDSNNVDVLENNNIDYCILNCSWDNWAEDDSMQRMLNIVKEKSIDRMVVDSYQNLTSFFDKIEGKVSTVYLDDFCDNRYNVDVVIHYGEWEIDYKLINLYSGTNTKIYTGFKYIPLREEFVLDSSFEKRNGIMITTGGTDPYHITYKVVKNLIKNNIYNSYEIYAVLGKMNKDKGLIEELCAGNDNIHIMQGINNMGEIMRKCMVAVSAGGTTVFELFASKVPVVCFGFSDNQVLAGERMMASGFYKWAGDARVNADDVASKVCTCVEAYLNENLEMQGEKLRKMVDGQGARRIAQIVKNMN